MIHIEGVSKLYDDKVAVDDLNLDVPEGSLFGLIGPNGAGKTTTLKMVSTLIKPDRGRIVVNGFDLEKGVRALRRIIGYMPDEFGSFRGLSCEEYLQFFGRSYGLNGPVLRRRLDDVLALAELSRMRDESTTALSAGMRQRLSLAKTLLHDPSILLLDEPASGLDPRARIEIRSLLKELARMGKTIVISSHILADLEEICTDVGILELGKVTWQGSLKSVLESNDKEKLSTSIQVLEKDAERALKLVRELDCVTKASLDGSNKLHAEINGPHSNRLLGALVAAEIEVLSFYQKKVNLETLFLERTRGIVS